jgi:hypothetical protein
MRWTNIEDTGPYHNSSKSLIGSPDPAFLSKNSKAMA